MTVETTTDQVIDNLLRFRLTRFAYGFCLGLKGNPNPSAEQREILARIVNQHSRNGEMKGNNADRFTAQ